MINKTNDEVSSEKLFNYCSKKDELLGASYNLSIVSSLLKRKRHERSMTLREVSESICSVSYLSKVESNKIVPNDTCLRQLLEKLDISDNDIIVIENSKELIISAIDAYLRLDIISYEGILCFVKDVEGNLTADLIKTGYLILTDRHQDAKDMIKNLIGQSSTLNDDMLNLLSIFTCEYLLGIHKYDEIQKAINTLCSMKTSEKFMILSKDVIFRCYVSMNRGTLATKLYHELIGVYSEKSMVSRLERIRKEYLRLLFESKEYSSIIDSDCLAQFGPYMPQDDEVKVMIGISYYEMNKQVQAKEYLDLIDISSPLFAKIINYKYALSLEKDAFIASLNGLNVEGSFYLRQFIAKVNNNVDASLFDSKDYENAFSKADVYERINLLTEKKNYLVSTFKYKDAVQILEKIEKMRN